MYARFLFEHQVEDTIRRFSMIPDHASVLAGCSGGADSTALLLVLCALAPAHDWHVEALHVEHGIRGEESRGDADFTMDLCRTLGVPVLQCSADVPALAKQQKTGIEETARAVRREKLLSRAAAMEAEHPHRPVVIALAHHAQDNAETLLFHLARGTGAGGLCGIRPVQGPFVRPLLCCTREEIEDYLAAAGQPWRTDSTNSDPAYARNRLRLEAVPALGAVNDQALRHMTDTAFQMQEMEDWLRRSAEGLLQRYREEQSAGLLQRGLLSEDPVPAKEALRLWLAGCTVKQVERVHVESAWQLLQKGRGRLSLPGGAVCANPEGLRFIPEMMSEANTTQPEGLPVSISIACGETTEAFVGGFHFTFRVRPLEPGEVEAVRKEQGETDLLRPGRNSNLQSGAKAPKTYTKRFDYDKIKQISLRTRQPGDTLVIGPNRHKSIHRYFIDMRVPGEMRDEVLLLCDGSDVLWVIGARMGDRCKLTEGTKLVLEVQVTEVSSAK